MKDNKENKNINIIVADERQMQAILPAEGMDDFYIPAGTLEYIDKIIARADQEGFHKANGVITGGIDNDPNNLSMKEIDLIDINELICYSIEGDDNPFVYRYTMDKDGEVRMEHFEDNITGTKWLDELIAELHNQKTSYARYHVDFFNLILCLLALAVAYICAVYKICQIIFELLISEIVLQFAAVLDMSGTERTKKVVANIVNSFLALFAMAILFRLYTIIYTIIMSMKFFEGHSLIRTIAVIAFSFGILNGPNVIKNILGVDVGFNDFSRGISSLYYSTMFAERMTTAGIRLAGAAAGAAGSVMGSVAGKTAASQFARDNGLMGTGGRREAAGRSESRSENSAQSSSASEQSLAAMSSSTCDSDEFSQATEDTSYSEGTCDAYDSSLSAGAASSEYDDSTDTSTAAGEGPDPYGSDTFASGGSSTDSGVSQTDTADQSGAESVPSPADAQLHEGPSELPQARSAEDPQRAENNPLEHYPSSEAAEDAARSREQENARLALQISSSVNGTNDLKHMLEEAESDTGLRSFDEGYKKGNLRTAKKTLRHILKRSRKV